MTTSAVLRATGAQSAPRRPVPTAPGVPRIAVPTRSEVARAGVLPRVVATGRALRPFPSDQTMWGWTYPVFSFGDERFVLFGFPTVLPIRVMAAR